MSDHEEKQTSPAKRGAGYKRPGQKYKSLLVWQVLLKRTDGLAEIAPSLREVCVLLVIVAIKGVLAALLEIVDVTTNHVFCYTNLQLKQDIIQERAVML